MQACKNDVSAQSISLGSAGNSQRASAQRERATNHLSQCDQQPVGSPIVREDSRRAFKMRACKNPTMRACNRLATRARDQSFFSVAEIAIGHIHSASVRPTSLFSDQKEPTGQKGGLEHTASAQPAISANANSTQRAKKTRVRKLPATWRRNRRASTRERATGNVRRNNNYASACTTSKASAGPLSLHIEQKVPTSLQKNGSNNGKREHAINQPSQQARPAEPQKCEPTNDRQRKHAPE